MEGRDRMIQATTEGKPMTAAEMFGYSEDKVQEAQAALRYEDQHGYCPDDLEVGTISGTIYGARRRFK